MIALTRKLHQAFLDALGAAVQWHSSVLEKPLCVNLTLPNPPRLRVYVYSLIGGVGTVRPNEYKICLRVPGQRSGEDGSFDHSEGWLALAVGYKDDLDVFVLWDTSLHPRFRWAGNLQVRDETVHRAASVGRAWQFRSLTSGAKEVVIACQSSNLAQALNDRLACTGGADEEDKWRSSPI